MPVSFNSPPRNFFLLGSGAQQALTNFFETVPRFTGTDRFSVSDIAYSETDQKYILSGSGKDSNSVSFGWLEKQDYDEATTTNVEAWRQIFESTLSPKKDVTLNFMKQTDSYGGDIIIGGKVNNIPWVARYDTNGAQQWVSSSFSGDLEYFGIACTASGYYACGHRTDATGVLGISESGFVEKWTDSGTPLWGKSAVHVNGSVKYNAIAANDRAEVVVVGAVTDQAYVQGYVAKLDANTGDVLWDKTINSGRAPSLGFRNDVEVKNVYIDGKDQIYVVGTEFADTFPVYQKGFIIKYSAEGNLIWHKTTPSDENHDFLDLWSDTPVEQTVVLSRETVVPPNGNTNLQLLKYSKNGDLVFKRRIITEDNTGKPPFVQSTAGLDGDPSFYYMLFVDQEDNVSSGTSKQYTFGQVSASGNGFGDFEYNTGVSFAGEPQDITYTVSTSGNPIGRLADGSVRNDTSDFISYPYSGLNLLLGDDLATNVSYKKTRHKDKDLFDYSGSPAQRPVDFQELNVLGDVYSGSGDWLDQSRKGNHGTPSGATHNANGYWDFDGTNDFIEFSDNPSFSFAGDFTVESWIYPTSSVVFANIFSTEDFDFKLQFLAVRIYTGSGSNTSTTCNLNEWNHVLFYRRGSTFYVSINGFEQAVTPSAFTGDGSSGANIGRKIRSLSEHFVGRIGEVRVYQKALTAAEIYQNYNATRRKYTGVRPFIGAPIAPGFARTLPAPLLSYDFNSALCVQRTSSILPSTYQFKVQDAVPNGAAKGDAECVATGYGKVVVGSRADDNGVYTRGGRAFVYNVDGTGQVILTPAGISGNDMFFGNSVDICNCNGKIAVASASSLHIFDVDGTGEIVIDSSTTLPISPPGGATFGNSVAIDGDKVWVSDHNVPQGTEGNGTVYCFDVNTGAFLYQLRPKKSTGFSRFGVRIKARDGLLIIGADTVSHPVTGRLNTGRMYLYRQDGTNERIIEPEELTTSADFGISGYAIGYGLILVGAMRQQRVEGTYILGSGEVFAFDYKGNKKFSVRPSDDPTDENLNGMGFGGGIAISSDRIFIGAEYFQSGGGFAGKVYSFSHAGKELQSFQGSDTIAGDNFGTSAHASGDTLVIGAPTAGNTGAAYIYPVTNTPSGVLQNLVNLQSTAKNGAIVGATFDRGGYLIFDGVNDYLDLAPGAALTETDGWAVEGWFKFPDPANNNTASTWNYLFRLSAATSGGPNYEVGMYSTNNTFEIKDNGTAQQTISCTITPNTWHYLCFGQTGTGKLFLKNSNADGSFTTTQSTSAATSGSPNPIEKLFSSQTGGNNLNAHCGEIRIYNRELVTPEFTQNYNATRNKYGI